MAKKEFKLSADKAIALALIGIALSVFLFFTIISIISIFMMKKETPYLYGSYIPYREIISIVICIAVFILMLFFNRRVNHKVISAIVNIIVVIALCNPFTLVFYIIGFNSCVNYYTIENESDFTQCADDMKIDFNNFPSYNEFENQDVQFVGRVDSGFFFDQSITAIVKYKNTDLCASDYETYINSHSFLTEPVIESDGDYLIPSPEFNYDGIFFKVLTTENDNFPKQIYIIGIDKDKSTLYYLYFYSIDLDYIAEADAKDLEGEMVKQLLSQFNLGK